MKTSNLRIEDVEPIIPAHALVHRYPLSDKSANTINTARDNISDILHKNSPRLLAVVGPCSIHDVDAALEYAHKLKKVRERLYEPLEIVMRVYFEKPRSTIGWKGLINDPHLDQSYDVNTGLNTARKLLLDINSLGVPAGCEFLDTVSSQYYADLVSWGAIGARTTESQIHRELASGLSCPIGFKNATNGDMDIAIDAVIASQNKHAFLGVSELGVAALFTTSGNQDTHIILRGGKTGTNFQSDKVQAAKTELDERGIATGVMIDMSHANSQKDHTRQIDVGESVASQIEQGADYISGCMIESHLVAGKQDIKSKQELTYGQSITDACLDFDNTEKILNRLAKAVQSRFK